MHFENLRFRPSRRIREGRVTQRTFLKRCVFGDRFHWIRVDGRPNRKKKPPFPNKNGYMWTGPQSSVSLPMPFLLFSLLCYFIPSLHVYWAVIFIYCGFARDVTVAKLVAKNKSISLLWEINSIFMDILREKVLLYWPPTWPPCHVVVNQESLRLVTVPTVYFFLLFFFSNFVAQPNW